MTKRPSLYLKELILLASHIGIGEDIVQHQFIQALPPSIKPVIASRTDLETNHPGKMTDNLLYVNK